MNFNDLYPSKYLKAADIPTPRTLTIARVEIEELGQGEDKERKPVLYFEGEDRGLVLNKTNGLTVAALYGEESDQWIGRAVTMKSTKVPFGGKLVDSIRISDRIPGTAAAKKNAPVSDVPPDDIPF